MAQLSGQKKSGENELNSFRTVKEEFKTRLFSENINSCQGEKNVQWINH